MIVYLAELKPILASNGAEQMLRFCSHPSASRTDGVDWKPMLSMPLRRNVQLFDGQFQEAMPDFGALEFALSKGDSRLPITSMLWDGRPVKVWRGTAGQSTGQMTLVFTGVSKDVSGTKRTVSVSLRGNDWLLDKPVLTASYAGTGLAEGPIELKGRLKPMLLGSGLNIEPVYLNKALGIFQWHAYTAEGTTPDVTAVYDSGSQLGAVAGDFPDYAALAAAVVPAGRFITCRALGMARHGGEILGVLTIDASGAYASGLPGDLLRYLWGTIGGLAAALYNSATLTWVNGQIGHAQDIYVTEEKSILSLSQELMLSLGGYVTYLDDGRVTVGLLRRGTASSVALGRQNLASLTVRPTSAPVWKRRQGYQRSWRRHSFNEVRTPREITPRGAYSATTAYAYYDQVTHDNGSWIMVQAAPSTGVTPGTNNAVWTLFSNAGANVSEGTVLPATGNQGQMFRNTVNGSVYWWDAGAWVELADVTAANVASGIANQAATATNSDYAAVTGVTRPDNNATVGSIIGGNLRLPTQIVPTQAQIVTSEGTAAGILNQAATATNSDFAVVTGATRPAPNATVGAVLGTNLTLTTGGAPTQAQVITSEGVSSGYNGQQRYGFVSRFRLGEVNDGTGSFGAGLTEASAEWMSNTLVRTPSGVSSGFSGQRPLATRRNIRLGQTGDGSGDFGAIETENGLEWGNNTLFRTPSGISSGFTNQQPWATYSGLVPSNVAGQVQYLSTAGNLDNLQRVTDRRINLLRRADNVTDVTEAALVTSLGVSSGYNGQQRYGFVSRMRLGEINDGTGSFGSGLTEASAEWMGNGNIRTGSGTAAGIANQQRLATMERVRFGSGAGEGAIANESNAYWVNDASAITSAGIASGIARQGGLATRSAVNWDATDVLGRPAAITTLRPDGRLNADYVQYGDQTGASINDLKPGEIGANVTERRVASGIANQRSYATKTYFKLGMTYDGEGDSGAGLTEGGSEWMGNGNIRTGSGTAAAIANQKDWATYDGINTSAMAGRVSRQGNDGRVADPRIYNTQNLLGPSNTTGLVPTYSDYGGGITVNLQAHYRYIAGPGGPIGLYYGAGSFNVGYSGYWIAFIDDPDMVGIGNPSIGYTTSPTQLLYPGRYQVASGYAPNSGGGGGSTGGGGGGGFSETCVSADAYVAVERYGRLVWIIAADVKAGDRVWTMLDAETAGWTDCTANRVVIAGSVRLWLDSGRMIECSRTTPVTQPDMTTVLAEDALGALAGQNDGEGVAWGQVVLVEFIGFQRVAHLSCNDGTYLAAMVPGEGVFTHNAEVKP